MLASVAAITGATSIAKEKLFLSLLCYLEFFGSFYLVWLISFKYCYLDCEGNFYLCIFEDEKRKSFSKI